MNSKTRPVADRMLDKIAVASDGCWQWTGCIAPTGYGQIRDEDGAVAYTHRLAYVMHNGPVPDGLHLDHLCRNRGCCNPDHIEPVTQAENNRRAGAAKILCAAGHEMVGHNVKRTSAGRRKGCRTCINDRARGSRQAVAA